MGGQKEVIDNTHADAGRSEKERRAQEATEDDSLLGNDTSVRRPTRLGKRNWNPGYIVRVIDWCQQQLVEQKVGRRAMCRMVANM